MSGRYTRQFSKSQHCTTTIFSLLQAALISLSIPFNPLSPKLKTTNLIMKFYHPFSFLPGPVTCITTIVYLSIIIPLLIVHETIPDISKNLNGYNGINLTEAWLDLDVLSSGYHPFNSRQNSIVRDWIIARISEILDLNNINWMIVNELSEDVNKNQNMMDPSTGSNPLAYNQTEKYSQGSSHDVTIFNDLLTNYTSTILSNVRIKGRRPGVSTYFEGSNIIVYIRGAQDEPGQWWDFSSSNIRHKRANGGVLVNAHFDSVSTGYGATDDGMGVITALQLIKYFTTPENQPERGVVILLNNNEEDGLYGAKAFLSHPTASFIRTFLNLEGAGAGGRAILFRSTDMEVTRAYSNSPHPFGTVVGADGFALGMIKSETDYVIFREEGYRGLDVAFWGPRSRYHTDQDDTKHTSKLSLWHMLSASIETVNYLTQNSAEFTDVRIDDVTDGSKYKKGTTGVWFDLFGRFFAVFGLRTLFAWSLSLLVVSPLTLATVSYLLIRQDKYYLFAGTIFSRAQSNLWALKGWHGAFRFPLTLIISSAFMAGAALILDRFNPLIIYSSQYTVWAIFMSLFFCVFWIMMVGFNMIRPSALHRIYTLLWMFFLSWVLLIVVTVYEDRFQISSGYIIVFYQAAIFLATLIGLFELFSLPNKSIVVENSDDVSRAFEAIAFIPTPESIPSPSRVGQDFREEEVEANEETPLIGGYSHRPIPCTTFARAYRKTSTAQSDGLQNEMDTKHSYGNEQKWSAGLFSWMWLPQFLIIAPITLIIIGQVGLLIVSATRQTGPDGSALLIPYLAVMAFSILLVLPLVPFMHRITHHVPVFLFVVLLVSLVYNLIAFPFSPQNRCKVYFQQSINLDSRKNNVTLVGIEGYVRDIISYIPSAAGQTIGCYTQPEIRQGLNFCYYESIEPQITKSNPNIGQKQVPISEWLQFNVTRLVGKNKATFQITGLETKACTIRFDQPFSSFHVHGAASDNGRLAYFPDTGSDEIKLWHRDWNREWVLDVEWPIIEGQQADGESKSGAIVCLWSDHNIAGTIPALDEVQKFMPDWSTAVKLADGLVEGSKAFVV